MTDSMFFSGDERGLVRGRRTRSRTETCRPCIVHVPNREVEGVILNLTPHGMLIRSLEPIEVGSSVMVQLMRDDAFSEPMSEPRPAVVVRDAGSGEGFHDVAVRLVYEPIEHAEPAPVRRANQNARPAAARPASRMHTIDFRVGDDEASAR